MTRVAVWLLLCVRGTPVHACVLAFAPNFRPPPGRVAAIQLRVAHGSITGLRTIPVGWRITIDNDPSWFTGFRGHGIVRAACLDFSVLKNLMLVQPGIGHSCAALMTNHDLRLKVTLFQDDTLRQIVIDGSLLWH